MRVQLIFFNVLLVSFFFVLPLHAQTVYPNEGIAFGACKSAKSTLLSQSGTSSVGGAQLRSNSQFDCTKPDQTSNYFQCRLDSDYGSGWLIAYATCGDFYFSQSCSSISSKITKFYPPTGSVGCNLGCEVKYSQNGDDETTTVSPTGKTCDKAPDCAAQGVNMVWNSYLGVCQPVEPQCEQGFVKSGESCVKEKPCPDGMALQNGVCKKKDEECPAGSTKLPDGTCHKKECPEGSVLGDDGTCKPPPKENCEAGDTECEKKNEQFSGGDGCDVPPICSGSPILCGQARIQWRIDCNTRRNTNISGGPCSHSGTPTCTGEKCDAIEYAQLVMQWRAACAVEKMAENSSDSGSGNAGTPVPDTSGVSDGELSGQAPNDGNASGAFSDGSNAGNGSGSGNGSGNGNGLNSSGYGWSRSCPTPPTVNLMGQVITFNVGPFCNWMVLGGWLVLLFSALLSLRILSSSSNS